MKHSRVLGRGAFGPEPARDRELGALLHEVVGVAPAHAVDWPALAARISARVGVQAVAPWWSYAAQWERRMIPLALAAGIAAAVALWDTTTTAATQLTSASSFTTEVASGVPADDAASQFARTITNTVDPVAGVPE